MNIFIGADHNGFELKQKLTQFLQARGDTVVDTGNKEHDPSDDFPIIAKSNIEALQAANDPAAVGILICGSGQGVVMAANRYKGIRASLVWNESSAKAARSDDHSNVLCLAARELTDFEQVQRLVKTWLATPYDQTERFVRRVQQLDELA